MLFAILTSFVSGIVHLLLDKLALHCFFRPVERNTRKVANIDEKVLSASGISLKVSKNLLQLSHEVHFAVKSKWNAFQGDIIVSGFQPLRSIAPLPRHWAGKSLQAMMKMRYNRSQIGITDELDEQSFDSLPINDQQFARFVYCLMEQRKILDEDQLELFDRQWG